MHLERLAVVGVGVVDPRPRYLVELLAVRGDRIGEVDDVEDPGATMRVICTARMG
jgi:hypothetical protein